MADGALKDLAFVDAVGEALRLRLGAEFASGLVAFFFEELSDALARFGQKRGVEEIGQNQISLLVQEAAL
jgi:hypothetical protein